MDSFLPAPRGDSSDNVSEDDAGTDAVAAAPWPPLAMTVLGAPRAGRVPRRAPDGRALGCVTRRAVSAAGRVEGRPGKASGVCNRRVSQQGPRQCGRK